MPNYTLTYEEGANGFPSFYTYYPDWMIGMNNYFYSFKAGNLYRHNVNENRNTFYADWWVRLGNTSGSFSPSVMTSVFNDDPLNNKLFKTLNIEGDDAWSATLETDIQNSGSIDYDWFEKKEHSWYAFVRNTGAAPATPEQYSLRSLNGIGNSSTVTIVGNVSTINFATSIAVDSMLNVGDNFYFVNGAASFWAGVVTTINKDIRRGVNNVVLDTSATGTVAIPSGIELFMYIKNSIAESHGVLGHYCQFKLTSIKTTKIELFAAESEVMKSYP